MRKAVPRHPGHDGFFFAAVGSEEQLRKEVFFLGYHLHWAYAEIMDLDLDERREFIRLLAEQIEKEAQAVKNASRR